MKIARIALAIAGTISSSTLFAAEPTVQELMKLIKKQQAQIEALAEKLEKTEDKVEETDDKIETTVSAVESAMTQSTVNRATLGGYGELHYNNIDDTAAIDFHRFVTFLGYEFTDKIRFYSELEIEHALAGDGAPGEVELEQAYVEIDFSNDTSLQSGVFLVPVGILNETHEPPTFYGVERNPVEKNILPSTWWEGGVNLQTRFSEGVVANFAVHSGLDVPTDSFSIRSGRQKIAKANADSLAYTARLKYTAVPGLELSASYQHQTDITQGALGADANFFTAHAIYKSDTFGFRALYASWKINSLEAEVLGRDSQNGFYVEPSYKFNEQFGIFARYNAWDNNEGNAVDTEKRQTNIGLNYWPHAKVVFKFDIENRTGDQDGSGFNLGVGYRF